MTKQPTRAMALSFHGGTGTGKNYVSKIIAENIYHEGMKSQFVHLIAATKEFPHEDMVPLYKVCTMYCKTLNIFCETLFSREYRRYSRLMVFMINTNGRVINFVLYYYPYVSIIISCVLVLENIHENRIITNKKCSTVAK